MIVRILGEGQLELPDSALVEMNDLDAALERSLTTPGDADFRAALDALLARVRELGTPLELDALAASDVVLPFADATKDYVRDMLRDDGLIPG